MKLLNLLLKVDQVHEDPEPSAHVHSKQSLVLLFVKLCKYKLFWIILNYSKWYLYLKRLKQSIFINIMELMNELLFNFFHLKQIDIIDKNWCTSRYSGVNYRRVKKFAWEYDYFRSGGSPWGSLTVELIFVVWCVVWRGWQSMTILRACYIRFDYLRTLMMRWLRHLHWKVDLAASNCHLLVNISKYFWYIWSLVFRGNNVR